jgi:hypothetical protein
MLNYGETKDLGKFYKNVGAIGSQRKNKSYVYFDRASLCVWLSKN